MIRIYCDICDKQIATQASEERYRITFEGPTKETQMVVCKDCYQEIIRDMAIIADRKKYYTKPTPIPMTPTK